MKDPCSIDLTPEDFKRYMQVRREKIMRSTSPSLNEQRHLPVDQQGPHSVMGRVDYRRVPEAVLRDALNETTDQGEEFTEAFLNFFGTIIRDRPIGKGMIINGESRTRKTA